MKHASAILVFLFTMLSVNANAQNLPRRVMFGVGTKPLDAISAQASHVKLGSGVVVTLVVPNSTAGLIGIKPGDVLSTINGKTFTTQEDLAAYTRTLNAGDSIDIEFVSNGKKVFKSGINQGRPKDTSDFADIRYESVESDFGSLRSIIHVPKNKTGKLPAIFYLQGYPCSSQEFAPNSRDALKRAIDDWVMAGYVVFRFDRPNMGDSRTSKDCRDTDYDEELAINVAAYIKMMSYDFVDTKNIFLFGHSLGGVTAPLLAQTFQPKGIIVYGVVLRSWFEYFIDIQRVQALHFGSTRNEAETATRELLPIYFEWLEMGKSPMQLKQNPTYKRVFDAPDNPLHADGDYMYGRHYKFWSSMNKKQLTQAWSKVTGKVLAMYGEFDVQAINALDAQNIAAVVNETHPDNGEFIILPKTDHGFLHSNSYVESVRSTTTGNTPKAKNEDYNPELGRVTVAWLDKLRKQ